MNTLRANWVKDQFKQAVIARSSGNLVGQPRIQAIPEFAGIFDSELYLLSRSMFTTRMRMNEER